MDSCLPKRYLNKHLSQIDCSINYGAGIVMKNWNQLKCWTVPKLGMSVCVLFVVHVLFQTFLVSVLQLARGHEIAKTFDEILCYSCCGHVSTG